MKKAIALLLAIATILALSACNKTKGGNSSDTSLPSQTVTDKVDEHDSTDKETETPSDTGKETKQPTDSNTANAGNKNQNSKTSNTGNKNQTIKPNENKPQQPNKQNPSASSATGNNNQVVNEISNIPSKYINEYEKLVYDYVKYNNDYTVSDMGNNWKNYMYSKYDKDDEKFNLLHMEEHFSEINVTEKSDGTKVLSSFSTGGYNVVNSISKEQIKADSERMKKLLGVDKIDTFNYIHIQNDEDIDNGDENDIPEPFYNSIDELTDDILNDILNRNSRICFYYKIDNNKEYSAYIAAKKQSDGRYFYMLSFSLSFDTETNSH